MQALVALEPAPIAPNSIGHWQRTSDTRMHNSIMPKILIWLPNHSWPEAQEFQMSAWQIVEFKAMIFLEEAASGRTHSRILSSIQIHHQASPTEPRKIKELAEALKCWIRAPELTKSSKTLTKSFRKKIKNKSLCYISYIKTNDLLLPKVAP